MIEPTDPAEMAVHIAATTAEERVELLDGWRQKIAELEAGAEWVDAIAAREAETVNPVIEVLLAAQAALSRVSSGVVVLADRDDAIKAMNVAVQDVEIVAGNAQAAADAAAAHRRIAEEEIVYLRARISLLEEA